MPSWPTWWTPASSAAGRRRPGSAGSDRAAAISELKVLADLVDGQGRYHGDGGGSRGRPVDIGELAAAVVAADITAAVVVGSMSTAHGRSS